MGSGPLHLELVLGGPYKADKFLANWCSNRMPFPGCHRIMAFVDLCCGFQVTFSPPRRPGSHRYSFWGPQLKWSLSFHLLLEYLDFQRIVRNERAFRRAHVSAVEIENQSRLSRKCRLGSMVPHSGCTKSVKSRPADRNTRPPRRWRHLVLLQTRCSARFQETSCACADRKSVV